MHVILHIKVKYHLMFIVLLSLTSFVNKWQLHVYSFLNLRKINYSLIINKLNQ